MPKGILKGSGSLARLRIRARLTQAAAAAKLGVTLQHFQRLEQGLHDPRATVVEAMAKTYKVDIDAIMRAFKRVRGKAAA